MSTPKDLTNLTAIYRAKVVDNKDGINAARVKVWIPDVMSGIPESEGIWAMPANNAIGGRNLGSGRRASYGGQCLIPPKGTYCFVFFECGNPSRPYYFGAMDPSEGQGALPECRVGKDPSNKWVLLKSPDGRCITISDDPSDCRVEITGKKRKITEPPNGDTKSVYKIDTNQTTILLDERSGKEKLLIRSYKGDFINFDIENQKLEVRIRNKMDMVCVGDVNLYSSSNINITCMGLLTLTGTLGIVLQTPASISLQALLSVDILAWGKTSVSGGVGVDLTSAGLINMDAPATTEVSGLAKPPVVPVTPIFPVLPMGRRNLLIDDLVDAALGGE